MNEIIWDEKKNPSEGIVWDTPYHQTAKEDSTGQNLMASIGGAIYAPYLGVKELLGKTSPGEVADWQKSMAGLWSTPAGKAGTVLGGMATAAPVAFIPGANTMAGAALTGLGYGAAQPVGEDGSRLANAVEGMGMNVGGKVAGDLIGKGVSALVGRKASELAAQKSVNATRDATVREAQAAGYTIPPTQVNPQAPGILNRIAEGVSGKIQTGQAAAIKNQKVTDALAKQELGLPKDVPLTVENIGKVRQAAGTAYEQLKKFGPIQADQDFGKAMQGVAGEYMSLAQNMPSQRNTLIDNLLADLNKPTFNSSDAVELVKSLRFQGFRNVRSPDPEKAALGQIQIGAQNAIEDLIDRNLQASGNAGFLDVFRKARTLIAKSHTVENALEESTGKVVASKIGKEFSKGRPLTGGLATIGKVAESMPKAVQNVNTSMPGLSPLDAGAAILGSIATGGPGGAALPLIRPAVRSAILSKPWQAALASPPSYQLGLLGRNAPKAMNSEITKRLEQAFALGLLPAIQQ